MSLSVDEAEHSLEMHLPYIRLIFAGYDHHCLTSLCYYSSGV